MRLVIIKVNPDIINGGANSVVVGVFERDGMEPTIQINIPRYNLVQNQGEIKVGQEVKLIPAEAVRK